MYQLQDAFKEALDNNQKEKEMCNAFLQEQIAVEMNMGDLQKRLEIDIMVRICNDMALFPGKLYHTGEVLVAHSQQYFSKCTVTKAHEICKKRQDNIRKRLRELKKFHELYSNKMKLPFEEEAFLHDASKEIIEDYDESAEQLWRQQHRENVRAEKQKAAEDRLANLSTAPNEDDSEVLDDVFDELEMIEEMNDELSTLPAVDNDCETRVKGLMVCEKSVSMSPPRQNEMSSAAAPEDTDTPEMYSEFICSVEKLAPADKLAKLREKLYDTRKQIAEHRITTEVGYVKRLELIEMADLLEYDVLLMDRDTSEPQSQSQPPKRISFGETRVRSFSKEDQPMQFNMSRGDVALPLELKINHNPLPSVQATSTEHEGIYSPDDIYKAFAPCFAEPKPTKSLLKLRPEMNTPEPSLSETKKEEVILKDPCAVVGDITERSSDKPSIPAPTLSKSTQRTSESRFRARRKR